MKNTIPDDVIKEWSAKIPYIEGKLNRIRKMLKKYSKKEKHFEMRLRLAKEFRKKVVIDGNSGEQKDN